LIVSEFPIHIDPRAIASLKRMAIKAPEAKHIRLGVKGGGCSGFEYMILPDSRDFPGDFRLEIEGVTLVCDPKSAEFLTGSRLIATGNLLGGGLAFENPNAARSCGCGTSFTPK
jgi:iron-sulfur cluster assembly protein